MFNFANDVKFSLKLSVVEVEYRYEIVGVMPASFPFQLVSRVWVPIMSPQQVLRHTLIQRLDS